MRRSFYFLFAFVLVFAIGVIVYIFFFSKNTTPLNPNRPQDPLGRGGDIIRRIFIPNPNEGKVATSSETEIIPGEDQLLTHVWDKPTAGHVFVDRPVLEQVASTTQVGSSTVPSFSQVRATSTSLLFVDRTTGYIYEYHHKTLKTRQVSNSRIPGVYDATFFANGSFVVFRLYNEDKGVIVSSLYKIPITAVNADAIPLEKITDLPDNITSLAVSTNGKLLSYLVKTKTGSVLYTAQTDTPNLSTTATSLSFAEWTLFYGGNVLYITQKASAFFPGYTVEAFTGRRVISDKTGLVVTGSSDENNLIASMNSTKGIVSFLFNKRTGITSVLPVKTIASKCTFEKKYPSVVCGIPSLIPRSSYGMPDDWYQGSVTFSDSLYRISNEGTNGVMIVDLKKEAGENLDIIKLNTSSSDSFLSLINKKDGSLWFVNLELLSGD